MRRSPTPTHRFSVSRPVALGWRLDTKSATGSRRTGSTSPATQRRKTPSSLPARMKALQQQIRTETDRLIDEFIEQGTGDLAQVAWRQPGIVFFKYLLRSEERREG